MGPIETPIDQKILLGGEIPVNEIQLDNTNQALEQLDLEASQKEFQNFADMINTIDDQNSKGLSDLNKLDGEKIKEFIKTTDQNQVFDLYIKMIDINLDDVKHGPKDKKMFEDILKYIESKKGGLEAIRDYAISKELGLESVSSWTNFIESGKRIFGADWDGANIGTEVPSDTDLNDDLVYNRGGLAKPRDFEAIAKQLKQPDENMVGNQDEQGDTYKIPDSKLYSRDEFISYFNELNGERIASNENILNSVDISKLFGLLVDKLDVVDNKLVMKDTTNQLASGYVLSNELMKDKNTIVEITNLIGIHVGLNFVSDYECKTQVSKVISKKIHESLSQLKSQVDVKIKKDAYEKELKKIQDDLSSKDVTVGRLYSKKGLNNLDNGTVKDDIQKYINSSMKLEGKQLLSEVISLIGLPDNEQKIKKVRTFQIEKLGFTVEGIQGEKKADGKIGPETWNAIKRKLDSYVQNVSYNNSDYLHNNSGDVISVPGTNVFNLDKALSIDPTILSQIPSDKYSDYSINIGTITSDQIDEMLKKESTCMELIISGELTENFANKLAKYPEKFENIYLKGKYTTTGLQILLNNNKNVVIDEIPVNVDINSGTSSLKIKNALDNNSLNKIKNYQGELMINFNDISVDIIKTLKNFNSSRLNILFSGKVDEGKINMLTQLQEYLAKSIKGDITIAENFGDEERPLYNTATNENIDTWINFYNAKYLGYSTGGNKSGNTIAISDWDSMYLSLDCPLDNGIWNKIENYKGHDIDITLLNGDNVSIDSSISLKGKNIIIKNVRMLSDNTIKSLEETDASVELYFSNLDEQVCETFKKLEGISNVSASLSSFDTSNITAEQVALVKKYNLWNDLMTTYVDEDEIDKNQNLKSLIKQWDKDSSLILGLSKLGTSTVNELNLRGKEIALPNLSTIDPSSIIYELCKSGSTVKIPYTFEDKIDKKQLASLNTGTVEFLNKDDVV